MLERPSDDELVEIIDQISLRLSYKFRFGYHEIEDMKQQAHVFALEGIEHWDHKRPLENFLWTHIRNRLYNFKRNNYSRPEKPCYNCPIKAYDPKCLKSDNECMEFDQLTECELYKGWSERNAAKRSLMTSITNMYDAAGRNNLLSTVSRREIFGIIDQAVPVQYREDWIRLVNSLKLSKVKRERIIDIIQDILKENGIEASDW